MKRQKVTQKPQRQHCVGLKSKKHRAGDDFLGGSLT
jgi:hypothetical protein